MNSKHRFLLINLLAFEFILLNVVLISFLYFRLPEFSFADPTFLKNLALLVSVYNLSWLFIILYIRQNEFYFSPDYRYLKSLLISLFFFVGLATSLVVLLKITYFRRSNYIIPIFIFSFLNLIGHKYLLKYLKKRVSNLLSNTLLISAGYELAENSRFGSLMTDYGYHIMGSLDNREDLPKNTKNLKIVGKIKDLPQVLSMHPIDEIFIAMSTLDQETILKSIKIADNYGIRVKLLPENPLLLAKKYKTITMGDIAVFKLRQSPLDNFNKSIFKRLFDFFFAFFVILICSPVFLLICILIYLDSGGPILYAPYRKGEAGKTFKCYKFRTMRGCDNPLNGTKSTIVDDPRITGVGKFLRKSDLDELPQFFNVLKGDMSVIGPRPHRTILQNDLRKCVNNYMVRGYIKPGITGWAQVNGWRGPTVTAEQKNERIKHDLWYIENWSYRLDFKIIFLTLFGKHRKKAF